MSNEDIAAAIDTYRNANGIQWKSKLHDLFFSGRNNNAELQQFRNHHLPVLNKIKFTTTKLEIVELLNK